MVMMISNYIIIVAVELTLKNGHKTYPYHVLWLAPASPRELTRTLHKLPRTPSDSVEFHIGMVRESKDLQ